MFLTSPLLQEQTLQMRNAKIVSNTVLKMPYSISPFLQPTADSLLQIEDTLDQNQSSDFTRYTVPHSYSFKLPLIPQSADIQSKLKSKVSSKRNGDPYRSKIKTFLRIIRSCGLGTGPSGQERKYLVEIRYGNEAQTEVRKIRQKVILEKDPQILIQFFRSMRKNQAK